MNTIGMDAINRARDRWNAGDLDGYLMLYDDTAILHGYIGVEPGLPSIRKFYEGFTVAFPGAKLVFEDLFASGDRVACRFVVQGRHSGPFQGMPPTGKEFQMTGITILRFEGDKCVERWSQADFPGLFQQLGALPMPGS